MATTNTSPEATHGIATRFALVRGYLLDRVGVKQYTPVLIAIDPELKKYEDEIRRWWNSRAALTKKDEHIVARLERVVEILKNAKEVA